MIRFVLPVTVLFFAVIGYLVFQYQQNLHERLKADYDRQVQRTQEVINGYQINSDVTFENTIMQPDVLSILHQAQDASPEVFEKLHNQLYRLLSKKYENLQNIARVRQLQFHMPDGRSFLRMHRPDRFGDPLFDIRYSVKKANTELVRSQGFEEGRVYNGYRFVYPIIDRNQHLGSVEVSLSMKALTHSLSRVYEGTYCIMLDSGNVAGKTFSDKKSNYRISDFGQKFVVDKKVDNELCSMRNPLVAKLTRNETLKDHLKALKPFSTTVGSFWHFGSFVSHFIPLPNVENKTIAYLFSIQHNSEILSIHERFIYNLVLTVFVFMVILTAIIVMNKRQKELEKQAEILNDTVTELSENYEAVLKEQKYIKGLLETIFSVIDHLNRLGKVDKLLYASCVNLMHHDNYRFVHIHTYHDEMKVEVSQTAQKDGLKAADLTDFYESIEHESMIQTVLKHGELIAITELQEKSYAQPIIEYLQNREIQNAVFLPIQSKDNLTYGFMTLLTKQEPTSEERALLKKLGVTISQSITTLNRRELFENALQERVKNYKFILFEVIDLLEKRYVFTTGRSERVSKYAKKIAIALQLDNKNIATLVDAAVLHDIGNIKIPDNILLRSEVLTLQERKMIEDHVAYGARLLERLPGFQKIRETILYHHEHFDGSGYPHGTEGEEIPLLSRILAVADAFEAMTSYWIYKPPKTVQQAITELEDKRGTQFDPQIVNIASHVLKDEALEHLNRSLPTTGSDLQRLQYLLSDVESGLFDVRYLDILASSKFRGLSIEGMQIIHIENLSEQNTQQHSGTLNMLGQIFKKFYPNDLSFFVKPNYLILMHLETFDENLQVALFSRLETDKNIQLEVETIQAENHQDYLLKIHPILEKARKF